MAPSPFRVEVVDETGSTNADLVAAARAGAPHGSVLVARRQTAGRGRLDRRWEAPAGAGLLTSILFREGIEPLHGPTRQVGVAAVMACEAIAGVSPTLKWPNDLLLDGRKLGGILAEAGPGFVVVGLGLNVRWAPHGAACLGEAFDPLAVLDALLDALASGEPSRWDAYRSRVSTIGQRVRAEMPGGVVIEGSAIDVEPDGRLVVVDGCAITHRIDTADVVHLR